MAARRDTPAMRQYDFFKKKYPDCVLFFRMGDFYEMFDDDALLCHRVLGITLTQRTEGIPMAGVPYHSVENYLRRMIEAGYRVAVCDQVQDPKEVKGSAVIERAVTRVLTPGTLVDDGLLQEDTPSCLAAVCFLGSGDDPRGRVGVALAELSTGDFTLLDCAASELVDELSRRRCSEMLYCAPADGATPPRVDRVAQLLRISATPRPSWHFRADESLEALRKQFGVAGLAGFGLADDDVAVASAGAIIRYLVETQAMETADLATSEGSSSGSASAMRLRVKSLGHLRPPRREPPGDGRLLIDAAGLRALEVEYTLRPGGGYVTHQFAPAPGAQRAQPSPSEGSLLGVFSRSTGSGVRGCTTPMGRRLLRDWLVRPSAVLDTIRARHDAVDALLADKSRLGKLSTAIDGVQDVPRLGARIGLGRASPRDLVAMARSLGRVDAITAACEGSPQLARQYAALSALRARLSTVAAEIESTCVPDPPAHLRDGGLIRTGIDADLDHCRTLEQDSSAWLTQYQKQLIEEHDLPSLKVGFNKVFGYYIELPAAQAKRAPAAFTRRQTLTNAERYITPELKKFEDDVLNARDRAVKREGEMFFALCSKIAAAIREAAAFADAVAELDVLACFASKAAHRGWIRPEMVEQPVLKILQGRHPVLETILADEFVPNDLELGEAAGAETPTPPGAEPQSTAGQLAVITGPNMAGKSTFIRQVALLTLLAHAGSFVPAQAATIGLTDRIFTRIGADDALHAGQSTFMVEMVETSSILHHATGRSLVVLDEIGRGTSTLDGLSLAWAIAEHLAGGSIKRRGKGRTDEALASSGPKTQDPRPRTLFATHYHELTDLADRFPGRVVNLHVAVKEWGDQVVFLHRILPGRSNRSYGIHVARLAGLPQGVINRANELMDSLSVSHSGVAGEADRRAAQARADANQFGLFAPPEPQAPAPPHPAIEQLKDTKLETMSPMQAFDTLRELKKLVEPAQ